MKMMKKSVLYMLLAIAMLLSFTACSIETSGEDATEAVVTKFMDALMVFDTDTMKTCITEKGDFSELGIGNMEELKENMMMAMGLGDVPEQLSSVKADLEALASRIVDKLLATMNYEITGINGEGEEYVANVSLWIVDENSLKASFSQEKITEMSTELGMELLSSGKVTPEMSQEEILSVAIKESIIMMEKYFDEILAGAEEKEIHCDLTVIKSEAGWLIDDLTAKNE